MGMSDPIQALKDAMEKATPGPWLHGGSAPRRPWADAVTVAGDDRIFGVYGVPSNVTVEEAEKWAIRDPRAAQGLANAAFIVLARNHLPALLERLDRLEAVAKAARDATKEIAFWIRPSSGEPIVELTEKHGPGHRELRDALAALDAGPR